MKKVWSGTIRCHVRGKYGQRRVIMYGHKNAFLKATGLTRDYVCGGNEKEIEIAMQKEGQLWVEVTHYRGDYIPLNKDHRSK